MSRWRSTAAERGRDRTVLDDVVRDIGCQRVRRVIVNQAVIDWEGWDDPAIAAGSTVRWKLLVDGDRGPSRGLVTGVAEIVHPAACFRGTTTNPRRRTTCSAVAGWSRLTTPGPRSARGTAVFIPPSAEHALYCVGAEPLVFLFTFARDRFKDVMYHFDAA